MRIGRPGAPGWYGAVDVRDRLDELVGRIGRRYGTDDPAVTGTFFLKTYARVVVGAALVSLVTERRVPDVGPRNVAFRIGEDGIVRELALRQPRFIALPGDPDAGHADAMVLPDSDALRGWLRERLVNGHMAELIPLLRPRTRRGPRALWGTVSDMCSGALAILAEVEGTPASAARLDRECHAFLSTGPPLVDGPPLCPIVHAGGLVSGWQRVTCCLAYRLPDSELCVSCPCLNAEERARRLRAQLETRAHDHRTPI